MALIPEYPYQRTPLQPVAASVRMVLPGVVQAPEPVALIAARQAAERVAAVSGALAAQEAAEARGERRAEEARYLSRKQANIDAMEAADARQRGQSEGVVRNPDGTMTVVQLDNSTPANRAFNAGAQAVYFAGLQADMRARFARLATESGDDPERFRVGAQALIERIGPQVEASVRGEAIARMRTLADEHYAGLLHQRGNADRQLGFQTWQRQLGFLRDDMLRLAEAGQIGTPRYAQAAAELERHLTAGVAARFIDDGTRDLWRRETADEGTARALAAQVVREATRPGVARTYEETVRALESPDGRPNAVGSGATGPFQIMPFVRAAYPPGTSDADIMADLTLKNRASLQAALGRSPTDAEMFLAHRLGAGAAAAVIAAPPGTKLADVLAPIFDGSSAGRPAWSKVLEQNPYLRRAETTGDLVQQIGAQWARAAGGVRGTAQLLQQLDADLLAIEGVSESTRRRAMAQARSDLALVEGQRRQDLAELQNEAAEAVARLQAGFEVPPDAMPGFAARARALGDERLARRYDTLGQIQGTLAAARGQPVAELLAEAARYEARATGPEGTAEDAALANGFAAMARRKAEQLRSDPLVYGARVHHRAVGPLVPIDWGEPEAAAAALRTRVRQAGIVSQTEGVPVLPLTSAEMQALKARVAEGTAPQLAQLLGTLNALGGDSLRQVLAKLDMGSDRERVFAVAASVAARGDARIATEILTGGDVLRENRVPDWRREDFDREANAYAQQALREMPRAMGAVASAARNLYAARKFAEGKLTDAALDTRALRKAINDITGGILEWNGHKLIAPRPGMTQEELDRLIRNLPAERLAGAQLLGGEPVTPAMVEWTGVLVSVGDGRYLVNLGNGKQVLGPDGRRFELDLRGGPR